MNKPSVYIVILNWKKTDLSLSCVRALGNLDYPNFQIVVIDNSNDPVMKASLEIDLPQVHLVQNSENLGFTGGCNQGMRYALDQNADYIWLLNNDAEVPSDCLRKLVDRMEAEKGIGLLSPVIINPAKPKKPFYGTYSDPGKGIIINAYDQASYEEYLVANPDKIALWGTALLIRNSLVEAIGYMDEDFFAYFEDNDFSRRSSESGFMNRVEVNTSIIHHVDSDEVMQQKPYRYFLMVRNYYLYWIKSGFGKGEARFQTLNLYLPQVKKWHGEGKEFISRPMVAGLWHSIILNKFGAPPGTIKPPRIFYWLIIQCALPLNRMLLNLRRIRRRINHHANKLCQKFTTLNGVI